MTTAPQDEGHWRVLDEKELLRRDPWLRVYSQQVRLPDGQHIDSYHRIRLQDIAIVLAVDDHDRLLVFRGYRHGFGRVGISFPGGALDAGEEPLDAARRELREEAGLEAGRWERLHATVTNANYHCSTEHYFVARDLRVTGPIRSDDLESVEPLWLTRQEVEAQVRDFDTPVVLGVLCGLLLHLRRLEAAR